MASAVRAVGLKSQTITVRSWNGHLLNVISGAIRLLCLPLPCDISCTLVNESLYYLKEIEKIWRNSKPIRNLVKRFGQVGDIQALEITYSFVNGWHPHLHILFILAGN